MAETFDGVNVAKLNGLLGETAPGEDNIVALIYGVDGEYLPGTAQLYQAYELLQPQDATDLGCTASYDANNSVYLLGSIKDFFSYAPNARLYLVLVDVNEEMAPSTLMAFAPVQAAIRSMPKVKGISFAGVDSDAANLGTEVELVQAQINAFADEHRLIDFVLIQGNKGSSAYVTGNLPDLRTKNAPQVSVSIAQDPYIAAQDAAYAKQADIGSVLGMLAVRKVNENLGSVDIVNKPNAYKADPNYTLTRANRWADAKLSNGTYISTLSATTKTAITNKGYIFVGNYEGYDGMFFNDSPTCVTATSDYNRIENNRTWNKAARLIRQALLPRVKGVVKKNPTTGFIKNSTIGGWIGAANRALQTMVTAEEISGYKVTIAANQIPNASTPVKVRAEVVKDGIVHAFDVELGLTNNVS